MCQTHLVYRFESTIFKRADKIYVVLRFKKSTPQNTRYIVSYFRRI